MKFRLTILLILCCSILFSQRGKFKYNDGPYIKYLDQSKEVLWISEGKLYRDTVPDGSEYIFSHDSLTTLDIRNLDFKKDPEVQFDSISRFTAISDIHGQFDLFRNLLISQNVVDENDNWTYGDGHLVIVGDVMDRGAKVIESLWYIYHLEKKAEKEGGKVHLLLGNHELMVINSNLGYINQKYRYTSGITQQIYSAFFGPETFFGRWLSSKKITISINDVLFVHGGFSERIKNLGKPLSELNGIFQEKLFFRNENTIEADSFLNMLYFDNGPLWYRGYAFPSEFDKARAKLILKAFDKKHIVVGHTSMPEIKGLYGNRIILIDSSIKFGKLGEVLVYQDSTLFKGQLDGRLEKLISEEDQSDKKSIFTTIYEDPSPVIRIATPIRTVYKNDEEKYEESMLYYYHKNFPYSFNIGLRTSGNMRRKICAFPPLKVNFKKKEIKAFGYTESDKFKILMPCRNTVGYLEHLKTEHLIYELYSLIDSFGLQSKLTKLIIEDVKRDPKEYTGLILEHKDHFAERMGVKHVEKGILRSAAFDAEDYIRFSLFQYIIANPDWEITQRHNLVAIKKKDKTKLSLVPYDFDYCGLIHTDYAVPHESLPIAEVTHRYFMDKKIKLEQVKAVLPEFLSYREKIIQHVTEVDYLSEKTKKKVLNFLNKSFDILENEKRLKKNLGLRD